MMSPLIKNLVFALMLAFIGWVGYLLFIKDNEAPGMQDANSNEAILNGQKFLMQIQELEQMNLDDEVLTDQRFQSLVDHSVELQSEDIGRENPFGPLTPVTSE